HFGWQELGSPLCAASCCGRGNPKVKSKVQASMTRSGKTCFGLAAIILALVLAGTLHAQVQSRTAQLRADVRMILVPVTVIDHRGAAVNGLGQNNFVVLDDKVPQQIV